MNFCKYYLFINAFACLLIASFAWAPPLSAKEKEVYKVCVYGGLSGLNNYWLDGSEISKSHHFSTVIDISGTYDLALELDRSDNESAVGECPFQSDKCDVLYLVPSSFSNVRWRRLFENFCSQKCSAEIEKMLDIVVLDEKPNDYRDTIESIFQNEHSKIKFNLGAVNPYSQKDLKAFLDKYLQNPEKYKEFLDSKWAAQSVEGVDNLNQVKGDQSKPAAPLTGVVACSLEAQPVERKKNTCDFKNKKNQVDALSKQLSKASFLKNPQLALYLAQVTSAAKKDKETSKSLKALLDDPSLDLKHWLAALEIGSILPLTRDEIQKYNEAGKKRILEAFRSKPFPMSLAQYMCRNRGSIDFVRPRGLYVVKSQSSMKLSDFPDSVFKDPAAITALGCLDYGADIDKMDKWVVLLNSSDLEIRRAAVQTASSALIQQMMAATRDRSVEDRVKQILVRARTALIENAFDADKQVSSAAKTEVPSLNVFMAYWSADDESLQKPSSRVKNLILEKLKNGNHGDIFTLQLITSGLAIDDDEISNLIFQLATDEKDEWAQQDYVYLADNIITSATIGDPSEESLLRYANLLLSLPSGRLKRHMVETYARQTLRAHEYKKNKSKEPDQAYTESQQFILDVLKKETDPEEQRSIWITLANQGLSEAETRDELFFYFKKQSLAWQYELLKDLTSLKSNRLVSFLAEQLEDFKQKLDSEDASALGKKEDVYSNVKKSILNTLDRFQITSPATVHQVLTHFDMSNEKEKERVLDYLSAATLVDEEMIQPKPYQPTRKTKKGTALFEKDFLDFVKTLDTDQTNSLALFITGIKPKTVPMQDFMIQRYEAEAIKFKKDNTLRSTTISLPVKLFLVDDTNDYVSTGELKKNSFSDRMFDFLNGLSVEEAAVQLSFNGFLVSAYVLNLPKAQDLFLKVYKGITDEHLQTKMESIFDSFFKSGAFTDQTGRNAEFQKKYEAVKSKKNQKQDEEAEE